MSQSHDIFATRVAGHFSLIASLQCRASEQVVDTAGGRIMFVIAWQFDVQPGKVEEFERQYGSQGVWRDLFARSGGYIGTRLLRDSARTQRYVTLDLWTSEAAYQELRDRYRQEYEDLDAALAHLTTAEIRLGSFDSGVSEAEVI
jgi:heme-degrading monooxygenase HmoA